MNKERKGLLKHITAAIFIGALTVLAVVCEHKPCDPTERMECFR